LDWAAATLSSAPAARRCRLSWWLVAATSCRPAAAMSCWSPSAVTHYWSSSAVTRCWLSSDATASLVVTLSSTTVAT